MTAGRWIGLVALGAYPVLMHATLLLAGTSTLGRALVLGEVACVALVCVLKFSHRLPLVLAMVVVAVAINASWDFGGGLIVAASGIPHGVVNFVLLTAFGRSLLPGQVPLITAVSQRLSLRTLTPELHRYTRSVTLAWCCFFALELIASLLLLLFAPLAIWSFFINVLTMPLVAMTYLAEYTYRRLRFRYHEHRTILQVIEAFSSGEALKPQSASVPPSQ
jgi:uncharacterized membrane protein